MTAFNYLLQVPKLKKRQNVLQKNHGLSSVPWFPVNFINVFLVCNYNYMLIHIIQTVKFTIENLPECLCSQDTFFLLFLVPLQI